MPRRVDKRSSKTTRLFELFLKISRSKARLAVHELDHDEWGCDKTIGRMLRELNTLWERHNSRPLFSVVDAAGNPATRGERFIQVLDPLLDDFRVERIAAFPAVLKFLKVLDGTILEQEIEPIYKHVKKRLDLSKKDQQHLQRLERKFVYHGKTTRDYGVKADILDEVYEALLREVHLRLRYTRAGETKDKVVRPLGLVLYNNGLYLQVHYDGQPQGGKPYVLRIESVVEAEALRAKPFDYPVGFDPSAWFQGEFGLIKGDEPTRVSLLFAGDPLVKEYVRARTYTPGTTLTEQADGRLRLDMSVSDLTEVRSWVLSWGASVTVIEPASLRDDIARTVRRMLGLYSGSYQPIT